MSRATFNKKSMPIVDCITAIFEEYGPPLTVRKLYYEVSTKYGLVPFYDHGPGNGYDIVQRLSLRMRELDILPWSHFADRSRNVDIDSTWNGLAEFSESVNHAYRRDLWEQQKDHVEIWLEKDADAGFFRAALGPYRVGLYTIRGFSSKTFIAEAAAAIKGQEKPTYIYYFGDHDPSGLSIEDDVNTSLNKFGANLKNFERVGVNLDDAAKYNLRTLPLKKGDSRTKKYRARFGGESAFAVELDALPIEELRRRIRACVDQHIDRDAWDALLRVEQMERDTLANLTEQWRAQP